MFNQTAYREQAQKLLPQSVYKKGQFATAFVVMVLLSLLLGACVTAPQSTTPTNNGTIGGAEPVFHRLAPLYGMGTGSAQPLPGFCACLAYLGSH